MKNAVFPVKSFRRGARALEAAMTVCAAGPVSEAVHELRKQTRRVEAQMGLIVALHLRSSEEAHLSRAEKHLARHLKRVRRAAGELRDLDVQRGMLKDSEKEQKAARNLRKLLKKCRKRGARRLLKVLEKRSEKTVLALEEVLQALKPLEEKAVPEVKLVGTVQTVYRKDCLAAQGIDDSEARLHAIRKAAKQARYQIESANESRQASRARRRYEQLQELGGLWHDWLQLMHTAAGELGGGHALVLLAGHRSEEQRRQFEEALGN